MGIFLRQSHNVPPLLWGSPDEVRFSIWDNLERVYGVDYKSEVLIMPMFWGFPLLDYSKYGNNGTNHGATYKDGSLNFGGVDNWVTVLHDSALDTLDITIDMLVKYDNTNHNGYVASQGNNTFAGNEYGITQDTGKIGIYVQDSAVEDSWEWQDISYTIVANTLYHIVLAIKGNSVYYYINGKLYNSGVLASGARNVTGSMNLVLGSRTGVTTWDLDGNIVFMHRRRVTSTSDQIGLFHDNPYGLYRRVAKPLWSIPAAPSIYIPQIIMF